MAAVKATLTKSLRDAAKNFDASPVAKAFLMRAVPKDFYNRQTNRWQPYPSEADPDTEALLDRLLGEKGMFYKPLGTPLEQVIGERFPETNDFDIKSAFATLKFLNDTWESAQKHYAVAAAEDGKDEPPSSTPPISSLEETTEPVSGCLLVTHPGSVEPCFGRAVMVLGRHDDEGENAETAGSCAWIINKPTNTTLGKIMSAAASPMPGSEQLRRVAEVFEDEPIYIGGPCGSPMIVLHTVDELEGCSTKIHDGLYFGYQDCLETALELIDEESAKPSDFKLVLGTSLWGKEQLVGEMKQNHWVLVKGSAESIRHVATEHVKPSDDSESMLASLQGTMVSPDGAQLWGKVMSSLPGEYSAFGCLAPIQRHSLDLAMASFHALK